MILSQARALHHSQPAWSRSENPSLYKHVYTETQKIMLHTSACISIKNFLQVHVGDAQSTDEEAGMLKFQGLYRDANGAEANC